MNPSEAVLMFDSARMGAAFGTRATSAVDRVLLYRSEDTVLDLVVQPTSDGLLLVQGAVTDVRLDTPLSGARVSLSSADEDAETDEFGQFASSCLRGDATWTLEVEARDLRVTCVIRNDED